MIQAKFDQLRTFSKDEKKRANKNNSHRVRLQDSGKSLRHQTEVRSEESQKPE